MRIVVVGASGLIGAKTVDRLRKQGHDVVPASRKSGVNTITGEGLQEAIKDADVVLDVSNAPSWEDTEVMEFFEVSTKNLLTAGGEAGVKHHIALGVVGTDRLQDSGYFRAKQVQEKLIKSGKIPYTIVHATQFFEFLGGIADAATVGNTTNLSTGHMQPIAADDVAEVMASTCAQTPVNTTVEIPGPDRLPQNELVARYLKATGDSRQITAAADAPYYGVILDEHKLVPGPGGKICPTSLDEWLKTKAPAAKH